MGNFDGSDGSPEFRKSGIPSFPLARTGLAGNGTARTAETDNYEAAIMSVGVNFVIHFDYSRHGLSSLYASSPSVPQQRFGPDS